MRFKKIVALSLLSIAGLLAGTITPAVASAASNKPIIVGSKNVSESKTVSEIYALALEHEGYKVTRKPNISNNVIFSVIINHQGLSFYFHVTHPVTPLFIISEKPQY